MLVITAVRIGVYMQARQYRVCESARAPALGPASQQRGSCSNERDLMDL